MTMPAIILAAGASRRLGRPKQLVTMGGETLLASAVRVARESGAGPVMVVLGARCEEIAEGVDLSMANVIVNAQWERGIASSIHAGIEAAGELGAKAAMLLVCDQPRLTAAHLRALMQAFEKAGSEAIVASRYADANGIPAIFPARQFARLLSLDGDEGAKKILREDAVIAVEFEGGEFDVDFAEDLKKLAE